MRMTNNEVIRNCNFSVIQFLNDNVYFLKCLSFPVNWNYVVHVHVLCCTANVTFVEVMVVLLLCVLFFIQAVYSTTSMGQLSFLTTCC